MLEAPSYIQSLFDPPSQQSPFSLLLTLPIHMSETPDCVCVCVCWNESFTSWLCSAGPALWKNPMTDLCVPSFNEAVVTRGDAAARHTEAGGRSTSQLRNSKLHVLPCSVTSNPSFVGSRTSPHHVCINFHENRHRHALWRTSSHTVVKHLKSIERMLHVVLIKTVVNYGHGVVYLFPFCIVISLLRLEMSAG